MEEWKIKRIEELSKTTSGGTPSRKNKEYYCGDILWVKSGELEDNYIIDTEEKITQDAVKNSSAKLFPKGTILMAMYGATVGKTAILKKEATTNQAICGIIPNNDNFNSEFLRYQLIFKREDFLKQRYGGAQPNISQNIIKKFEVAIPSLPEQCKIAHVLSTVQKAIEQQDKIIRTTTELKKALMQKLFTEGTRGEPQKETEIGLVPESWGVVELGKTVDFKTGKLNSNAADENGIYPFFTCSQETFAINNYSFDQEAILLSGNNARAIYSVKHYKGKFNAYQRTYVLTILNEVEYDYTFLKYVLTRQLEYLRSISIGSQTKYLTLGMLTTLQIQKPDIDEQRKISKSILVFENKIKIIEKKKQTLTDLFKTLLHELMTEKRRVHELEFEKENAYTNRT
ncbi:Type-1 restriction enzyme MjaXIP specificity protein [ANME-1 cluster archaeon GoMg3.2]|nr:Type-1 restriction enzyme MjaXIP specificity protein [ANME-1 cluster archaeon GoMg3.2]